MSAYLNSANPPNKASNSKIIITSIIAVIVNALVASGVIPESLSDQTVEIFNIVIFALISYFRAFRTIDPKILRFFNQI